jgi:hypothetical protein
MAAPVLVNDSDVVRKECSVIHNQDIKSISTSHIYKQTLLSRFNFMKGYKIITVEKNHYLSDSRDVYLLTRDEIRSYRRKYNFLHVGLVQFSISCSSGMNFATIPVSISLRDSKYPEFEDSILVNVDSDLRVCDMKFNWFPKFSISLADLANSNNGLVVTIDPSDSSTRLKVKYKVCYKLMKKSLKPDYLFDNPVLELNTKKANVVVFKSDNQSLVQSVDC